MFRWGWNRVIGIQIAAGALVLAALGVPIAARAAEMPEDCHDLVVRFARAPDQGTPQTLAALQACLEAEQSGSLQATASPSAPAAQLPVEPWVRQPTRARGNWPSAEPWVHTSESWPDKPW